MEISAVFKPADVGLKRITKVVLPEAATDAAAG